MKTIWFINHYAGDPRQTMSGTRHDSLSRYLSRLGWNACIVAASTRHPQGDQFSRVKRLRERAEIAGVQYLWLKSFSYTASRMRRILNIAVFTLHLLVPGALGSLPKPDVIVGSTVHPFAAWAASVLARRRGVPFVFEVRDLWPETFVAMGVLGRRHLLTRMLAALELNLYRNAVAIVTTMPLAHQYITGLGITPEKIVWISNGVEPDEFDIEPRVEADEFVLTYFGSIGRANALHLVIEGFARAIPLLDRDLRLRLVGDGSSKTDLIALSSRLEISNQVDFLSAVPKAEIPKIAANSDALIASLLPIPVYKYGISLNKIFEYLAASRPIVFAGELRGNPLTGLAGAVCVGTDPDEIARGIERLVNASPLDRGEWGRSNREYVVDTFSYAHLAATYDHLLNVVVR